jgi:hypothetical protein
MFRPRHPSTHAAHSLISPSNCAERYGQTKEQLQCLPGPDGTVLLRSRASGATFKAGAFSTPSVSELRAEGARLGVCGGYGGPDRLQVVHLACGDVLDMHAENEGALFQVSKAPQRSKLVRQHYHASCRARRNDSNLHRSGFLLSAQVASQFNCLEMVAPTVTPEDGITGYSSDRTQGPACSLAAAAATAYRNYHATWPEQEASGAPAGQTAGSQVDNLAGLAALLDAAGAKAGSTRSQQRGPEVTGGGAGGADALWCRKCKDVFSGGSCPGGHASFMHTKEIPQAGASATSAPPRGYWRVVNGYTQSSEADLVALNERLGAFEAAGRREALVGAIRIGLHRQVGVQLGGRFWRTRGAVGGKAEEETVSQAFCSALAMGHYNQWAPEHLWEPLARLALEAAYEGTLWAAANLAAQGKGGRRVFLTFIGGGVFGNDDAWISDAIGRACARLAGAELEVVVCHCPGPSRGV